jgi:hypothetical protein
MKLRKGEEVEEDLPQIGRTLRRKVELGPFENDKYKRKRKQNKKKKKRR